MRASTTNSKSPATTKQKGDTAMAIVKTAPKKTTRLRKSLKLKFRADGYRMKDGRAVTLVPWAAQTAPPWRSGYVRVLIAYNATEMRCRRNNKTGHEQIVHASKLVRC